jgi:hypothetical protein
MAAGSIVVSLLMKTGSFETDTARAEKRLRAFEKSVVDGAKRISTGFLSIVGAVGGAIAVVDRFAESIAVYKDISEKIGDTASAVSGLQLAADQSSTSLDTVASASVRLTASLSKADDESSAVAKALGALNISLEDFKRLSPVAQLERVSAELAKFADGAGKTAVAVALFGRAGAELLPFLNDLADAGGRNVRLTEEQIQAADQFTKTLATMKSEMATTAKVVSSELIPPFQAFLDYMKESEAAATVLAAAGAVLRTVFEALSVLLANVVFVFAGVGREIGALAAQTVALARLDIKGFTAISDAVKDDAARARAELDRFEQRVLNVQRVTINPGADTSDRSRSRVFRPALEFNAAPARSTQRGGSKAGAEKQSEADRYLESLKKQLERTKELTVVEQLLNDIQAGRLGKVNEAQKQNLVAIAAQIDAAKAFDEAMKANDEQVEAAFRARKELADEGARVFEATRTPLENYNAEIERLNLLYRQGAIDAEVYARAIGMTGDAFSKSQEVVKESAEQIDSFTQRAAENIQDQLGEGLFQIMKGNFSNIADSFSDMVFRMVAEAQAAQIAKYLFGDLVKGGSGSGAFGDFFSSIIGSFGFGGARASGGDVMGGRSYLVGEQGPEMFVPRTAGTILNAKETARTGSSTTSVTIHQHFVGQQSRQTMEQGAASAGRVVNRAVSRATA